MKQSKFSLADLLTLLTAVVFGFFCFLGENFLTLGNTNTSVIWAVLVTLSLTVTAFSAKLFKRASRNFRINFILELIALLLFTVITVYFSYTSFPHYFNVTAKKTIIQQKLSLSISQAENMFSDYESEVNTREYMYKANLQSAVTTFRSGLGKSDYDKYCFVNGPISDSEQIDNKLFTLDKLLLPPYYSDTSTLKGIKEVATSWLKKAKIITSTWSSVSIVSVINDVEKNSINWRTQLVNLYQVRANGEIYNNYYYNLTFEDVKKYFTTKEKPTLLTMILAVVAYLLMLMSYMVSIRSSKSTIGINKEKGEYDIDF